MISEGFRKTYQVHSFSLFLHLAKHNILPVGTKQRAEDPSKTVFFYIKSDELDNEIKKYEELKQGAKRNA